MCYILESYIPDDDITIDVVSDAVKSSHLTSTLYKTNILFMVAIFSVCA